MKKYSKHSPIVQKLLSDRGIIGEEEIGKFLNPDYEKGTHSPFLLKDMEKAVKRVLKAIKENERICIYSDYDADGIPGAVILNDYFEKIGFDNFFVYIPHREEEGFGLNKEAIKEIEADLLITVDCGITDVAEVDLANELGVNVIITDHHLPNGKIPKAFAIINPKQKSDKYPFKEICGATVAYKLVQALIETEPFDIKPGWEKWLLDMVGIATVSDMVPLVGENRVLAHFGLKVLRKSRRYGLKEILRRVRVNQRVLNEDDIGFSIAPRINAASRMDQPLIAFEALASKDISKAIEAVKMLEKINRERRGLAASMVREVKRRLKDKDEIKEIIVTGSPNWKPGLVGLVAGKIAEEFDKPTYVWGQGDSKTIKGSFRSNQKVDVFKLTSSIADGLFLNFGGHTHAGGFDMEKNKIHLLEELLNDTFAEGEFDVSHQENNFDDKLTLEEVNKEIFDDIQKLSPFGMGNPKPVFLFEEVKIKEVKSFGKGDLHTKLIFSRGENNIESISFFDKLKVEENTAIDLLASIEENNFMGNRGLRLRTISIGYN